jgi:hypothetical protein
MWPCVEEDDETSCSAVNNMPCIKCVGILGGCSDYITMQYTNAVRYDCTGGCPGECDDVDSPICYRTYKCKGGITYNLAECTSMSEIGPVPLDCYPQEVTMWRCTLCAPDYDNLLYTGYTPSSRCQ